MQQIKKDFSSGVPVDLCLTLHMAEKMLNSKRTESSIRSLRFKNRIFIFFVIFHDLLKALVFFLITLIYKFLFLPIKSSMGDLKLSFDFIKL